MQRVTVCLPARSTTYEIRIAAGLLSQLGENVRGCLGSRARRVVIISNPRVFDLFGTKAVRNLRASGFEVSKWLMKDGERHKNLRSLERALNFFNEAGLERNDAVIALGGGIVGDLAGFAAATYLRGI